MPDVEKSLSILKQAADLKSIELELPQLMSFYVPPDSIPTVGSENRVPLEEKLKTFLTSNESVLLLLGDAGMGKTVAGLKLIDALWKNSKKIVKPKKNFFASLFKSSEEAQFIPLRIELKSFNEATAKHCVETSLIAQGLSQSAIEQLKQSQYHRLLVIFDGLDELAGGGLPALFVENGLNEWKGAKAIIGCRNEYLVNYPHYKNLLNADTTRNALIECQLAPLTEAQIEHYIESRVNLEDNHPDKLTLPKEDYLNLLEQDANLKALIQTPFLLKLYTEARAHLVVEAKDEISRAALYEAFMKEWFHRQARKVIGVEDITKETALKKSFLSFSKSLAFSMYAEGLNEVTYGEKPRESVESTRAYESESDDEFSEQSTKSDSANQIEATPFNWEQFFSDKDPEVMEKRRGCPLRFVRGRYSFIHQSFLEYFIARRLFKSLGKKERRQIEWGARCLMKAPKLPVVVDFLALMVQEYKTEKQIERLYQLIQASKGKTKDTQDNAPYRMAASNAMTVLNYANHSFALYARTHPNVFQQIAAPYANLMQAELSGIDFTGSDLSNTWLERAILDHTNFNQTNLDLVEFRQMPAIKVNGGVIALCTPQEAGGMMAGVTYDSHDIQRWMAKGEGYEGISPIKTDHEEDINSVSMSPDGEWIASGSYDKTVRLWRAADGTPGPVCRGHEREVRSVALNRDWIVSGSLDNTVRLWRAADGTRGPVCRGHEHWVMSVALNRDWIVSGSLDKTVRLWRAADGTPGPVCQGHEHWVMSVALNRDWIVSGSEDKTVRLWRAADGTPGPVCRGHEETVNSVALNRDWIVSGSLDNTVRLWRAADGTPGPVCRGHESVVWSVALNRDWIVSGSVDRTVRLWRATDGTPGPVCRGHESVVWSVALNRDWIVSGSVDRTVRLWRAADGTPGPVCLGHEDIVIRVAFSPKGDLIASWSYNITGKKIFLVHRITDGALMREGSQAPWVKEALDEKNNTHLLPSGVRLRAEITGKMVCLVEENPSDKTAIRLWTRGRNQVRLTAKGCCFFGSQGLTNNQKLLLTQEGAIVGLAACFEIVSPYLTLLTKDSLNKAHQGIDEASLKEKVGNYLSTSNNEAIDENVWPPHAFNKQAPFSLHLACVVGKVEWLKACLMSEAVTEGESSTNERTDFMLTPSHVNALDENGITPLQLAVIMGHTGLIELLIGSGAKATQAIEAEKSSALVGEAEKSSALVGEAEKSSALVGEDAISISILTGHFSCTLKLMSYLPETEWAHIPKKERLGYRQRLENKSETLDLTSLDNIYDYRQLMLRFDPESNNLHHHFACCAQAKGELEKAKQHYLKALSIERAANTLVEYANYLIQSNRAFEHQTGKTQKTQGATSFDNGAGQITSIESETIDRRDSETKEEKAALIEALLVEAKSKVAEGDNSGLGYSLLERPNLDTTLVTILEESGGEFGISAWTMATYLLIREKMKTGDKEASLQLLNALFDEIAKKIQEKLLEKNETEENQTTDDESKPVEDIKISLKLGSQLSLELNGKNGQKEALSLWKNFKQIESGEQSEQTHHQSSSNAIETLSTTTNNTLSTAEDHDAITVLLYEKTLEESLGIIDIQSYIECLKKSLNAIKTRVIEASYQTLIASTIVMRLVECSELKRLEKKQLLKTNLQALKNEYGKKHPELLLKPLFKLVEICIEQKDIIEATEYQKELEAIYHTSIDRHHPDADISQAIEEQIKRLNSMQKDTMTISQLNAGQKSRENRHAVVIDTPSAESTKTADGSPLKESTNKAQRFFGKVKKRLSPKKTQANGIKIDEEKMPASTKSRSWQRARHFFRSGFFRKQSYVGQFNIKPSSQNQASPQ